MGLFDDLQNPNFNMFAQKPVKKVYKDPNDRIKQLTAFENGVYMLIGKEFGGMANGFEVRWEAKNFRPSQFENKILKDIKDQVEGRKEKVAEIYLRGKYLCDVRESMSPEQTINEIQTAIMRTIK